MFTELLDFAKCVIYAKNDKSNKSYPIIFMQDIQSSLPRWSFCKYSLAESKESQFRQMPAHNRGKRDEVTREIWQRFSDESSSCYLLTNTEQRDSRNYGLLCHPSSLSASHRPDLRAIGNASLPSRLADDLARTDVSLRDQVTGDSHRTRRIVWAPLSCSRQGYLAMSDTIEQIYTGQDYDHTRT